MTSGEGRFAQMRRELRWLAMTVGVLVWVVTIFVPYYVVHKPISVPLGAVWNINRGLFQSGWALGGILDSMANLSAGVLVAAVSIGLGWELLRLWPDRLAGQARDPRYSPLLTRLCFSAGLGLGVLGLAVFVLAASGQLYWWSIDLLLGGAAAWCLSGLRRGWPAFPDGRQILGPGRLTGFEWTLILGVGVALALSLVSALVPPTAWDSLVYHLTAPQLLLEEHRFVGGVDVAHFYFPELMEMLFVVALSIRGPIAAQLIQVAFLALMLLAIFAFAQMHFNRRVGLLACAIYVSAQSVLILASQAYVDVALSFFLFLAFWTLYDAAGNASESGGRGQPSARSLLLLSAVFAGFGMSVKYTSAPFVAALAILVAWAALRSEEGPWMHRLRGAVWPAAVWCGVAAIVASPWYLKNLGLTGNPVYPFVFGGWAWDDWRAAWFLRAGSGLWNDPLRLVLAPWEMTVLGVEGREGYQATIGPLFLLALPLVLLVRRHRSVRWALFVCGVVYGIWLAGVAESRFLQQTRLLLPIFGLLALVGARALEELRIWDRPFFRLQTVVSGVLIMALGLSLVSQAVSVGAVAPWAYALGAEDRDSFLVRQLGENYQVTRSLDQKLPPGAKVWFLWEPRSYYTSQSVQPDVLLDNWVRALYMRGSAKGVRDYLVGRGYSHVLIYRWGLEFSLNPPNREVTDGDLEELRSFESSYLKRVWGDPLGAIGPGVDPETIGTRYAIYELR
ncbi:MAG: phospholipid carrier-dependent glycosyltransferase [Chloroflexota bacterium]|nr:MAG: phospholipid carrier-dependent glycosyltransferase [Chloroflexota bacterium]